MFWIIVANVLLGDKLSSKSVIWKVGYNWQGNIVYHISKVSEIVLILKPAGHDDIVKSDGENSYCHFKVPSPV